MYLDQQKGDNYRQKMYEIKIHHKDVHYWNCYNYISERQQDYDLTNGSSLEINLNKITVSKKTKKKKPYYNRRDGKCGIRALIVGHMINSIRDTVTWV